MWEFRESAPSCQDAAFLLDRLNARLAAITGSDGTAHFRASDVQTDGVFLIAYLDGEPLACGALRPLSPTVAEVKRVYALPNKVGAGHHLLAALEAHALRNGYRALWLETRKINTHAVAFYEGCGYRVQPNYGPYIGRSEAICFAKVLSVSQPEHKEKAIL